MRKWRWGSVYVRAAEPTSIERSAGKTQILPGDACWVGGVSRMEEARENRPPPRELLGFRMSKCGRSGVRLGSAGWNWRGTSREDLRARAALQAKGIFKHWRQVDKSTRRVTVWPSLLMPNGATMVGYGQIDDLGLLSSSSIGLVEAVARP